MTSRRINTQIHTATVPRKRRPRAAAGEVSITSSSLVYLQRDIDVLQSIFHQKNEPVYQNQKVTKKVLDTWQFNAVRVRLPLNDNPTRYVEKQLSLIGGVEQQHHQKCNKPIEETQMVSVFIDDSDHYYESLCPMDEHQHQANQPKLRTITNVSLHSQFEDDYDSFDTDNDEGTDYEHADAVDEDNEDAKKNDSGVDVSHPTAKRLPEPPVTPTSSHPTNQVYALVQKLKNLGSLPKSLKLGKKKSSPSMTSKTSLNEGTPETKQVYENAQFYVDREYQNTTFTGKKLKTLKKLPLKENQDPYENTEFHSPRTPVIVSPTTPTAIEQSELDPSGINGKKKDKYTKSFKSKFKRKSLGNESSMLSGSGETRSTFYVCDSAEMDSGIFTSQVLNTEQPTAITKMPELASGTLTRRSWRFMSSPELNRRKSTLRPNDPPPPPPTSGSGKQKRSESTTSWYTEVGVFNSKHEIKEPDKSDDGKSKIKGQTSWYTEAGVYQTISGASLASSTTSSNSSGVSTGDDHSHSMFLNEPLYQIYSAAKLESISQDIERAEASNCKFASKTSLNDDESDGYEEIGALSEEQDGLKKRNLRPSALQLVGPKYGPSRTLWSEIPEVRSSEILSTLTPTEKRLQEAKFEILTSEASYLKSLSLLKSHFINHPAFRDVNIITTSDRRALFAYVTPVLECSDRLLCDLEKCWQDNIMLIGLSRSVYKHAEAHFHVYVAYCEHQGKMDRTLKRLKGDQRNTSFFQSMEMLETDPKCCGLSLHSFLMLPMQRITRLPLLVDAVLSKLHSDDDEFDSWKMTLAILNKIVAQCNEAANKSEQTYEMEIISKQIEFPPYMRPLAIQPVGVGAYTKRRALVRRGELTHLVWRGDDGKLTFGKKFTKQSIYIFLFTDLLVLAKKKAENCYLVQDYCPRSMLNVSSGDVIPQLPTKDVAAVAGKHLILMTLLENYDEKTVELILACPSETERQRWLQATEPLASENPDDKIYEQWDCPQVMAKHVYQAQEPDELALDPGDIVNVTKKMADGWYQGERIRDGAQGWFPGNYVEEVASPHVRARNLKQRYRLLTFTSAYLESQKKK